MAVVLPGACQGMPNPDVFSSQAGPRKNVLSSSSKKKAASGDNAGFTFVDQSADLRSIADKKIVDSEQRHLIRSHVMKTVRENERIKGKKRPTGRESGRKASASTPTEITPPSRLESSGTISKNVNPNSLATLSSSRQISKIPRAPAQGKFNPFNSLPGGPESSDLTGELIQYCFHTFIPMTFPIEASSPRQYDVRRIRVLQSQSANTATFFGLLATVAAHRTIIQKRHKDLSPLAQDRERLLFDDHFGTMKSNALQATQERIAKNGWDGPTVEAIFSLIGAEQILGNFEEARFHLTALRKFFMEGNGLDSASPASDWIPLIDVKGAIGTMSRPLFRLPWNPDPVPRETLEKLYGGSDRGLWALGTGFRQTEGLGSQLQVILEQASVLCRFCQFNATSSHLLTPDEYEMFRRKTLELEYDVLSYVYPGSPSDDKQIPNNTNPTEQLARLAILGITSSVMTKVLPSAGVGRALTHYQNMTSQTYFKSLKKLPDQVTLKFIVWALTIFVQCAYEQPEHANFISILARCTYWAGINSWEDLETSCSSFLYIPAFQQRPWREIWTQVQAFRSKQQNQQQLPARATIAQPTQTHTSIPQSQNNNFYMQ